MDSDIDVRVALVERQVEHMVTHVAEQVAECKTARKDLASSISAIQKDTSRQVDSLKNTIFDVKIAMARTNVITSIVIVVANAVAVGLVGAALMRLLK